MVTGLTSVPDQGRGFAPFLRAIGVGAVVIAALSRLPQFPVGVATALVAVCALAALASMQAGVVCCVLVVGYPLCYVNPVLGALFILAGIISIPVLTMHDGAPFFLLGGAAAALLVHAEWAIPVLAGFYLGTGEAVMVGVVAAAGIELGGFLAGDRFVGSVLARGTKPMLKLTDAGMPGITNWGWIAERYGVLPIGGLGSGLISAFGAVAMFLQPMLWGAAAGVVASIPKPDIKRVLAALGAGLAILFFGQSAILRLPGSSALSAGLLMSTLIASALVAAIAVGATLLLRLRHRPVVAPVYYQDQAPVAERAPKENDVVDLLRTISHAEEQIREKFTANATILLSDMKEFSKMTHEQGSIPSAKTVQRHRDLLIPVIQRNGGTAKPTGGDGIMAAFENSRSAIQAAVDMQNVLAEYNAAATADTQVLIRVGINTGEVVFDKDGTPFIGDGVNTSARVMALADGGQILVSKSALEEAMEMGDFKWQYLGTRDLKGVAVGAHIYEILWHQGAGSAGPAPSPQSV